MSNMFKFCDKYGKELHRVRCPNIKGKYSTSILLLSVVSIFFSIVLIISSTQ